ncbi:Bug family tripartite tricarboxylate transporter substrate binding protein [Variovorax sp. GB1P17]|uniref:Bug family tripartite tricarboxylate transporter substrate binding protein n=1 Tax=Variovorax sp. GB1P17 TaxID=3443740 RepID=UPI003F47D552
MPNIRRLLRALPMLFLALAAGASSAQAYPTKPITIIVPFPPGGIADPVARLVSRQLADVLGQAVIIDNKPGGGGQIAAAAAKHAPPDGHTLFMGTMGTQALNSHLFAKLAYAPSDFIPITPLVQTPHWLIVHQDSPLKSVADLVASSKTKPEGLTFASQGIGTGGQLLGEMLKGAASIPGTHVPYRGSAPALQDLLGNRVDFFFDSVSTSLPFVREGKLRVLAVATSKRLAQAPDVPTLAELGYPGLELSFWFGMFAPAGTPPAIINRLNTELAKIMRSSALRQATEPIGLEVVVSSPAELTARIEAESRTWGKVIKAASIRAD